MYFPWPFLTQNPFRKSQFCENEEDEDVYLGNKVGLASNQFEERKSKSGSKERLGLTGMYKYVVHESSIWLVA